MCHLAIEEEAKKDETIFNIIKTNSAHLRLSDDFINFINKEGKNLNLNKILSLYSIFEHLLSKDLFDLLGQNYKVQIPEETKNKIIEKLLKNNNENDLVPINELAAATRRFITRYLVGTTQIVDMNENRELYFDLTLSYLWDEPLRKSDDLMDSIYLKLEEFKLKISQAYEFYNISYYIKLNK